MIKFSVIAAAVAAIFAFAAAPASAGPCDDDRATCSQASPMKLDTFMKTWKPVTASKQKKYRTSRSARSNRRHAVEQAAAKPARETQPAAAETRISAPTPEPAVTAAAPATALETDGVAVTSFNAVNEIDAAAAGRVQIVAFNEVNEIDLAAPPAPPAPPPPAPVETVSQATAAEPAADDNSWIGKLLLAAAGTLALAGATRLLVA
jgi:hypothetical protein